MISEEARPFPQAVAVTGGIGTGKSRVARWLAKACALPLYDADEEVRSLLIPGQPGWQRLRTRLGSAYFAADGTLLKAKLRQRLFADVDLRRTVEHELHPLVLANLQAKISGLQGPCLVEVPLLFEVRWQEYFAAVLVVYADDSTCLERVMIRDGIPEDQAKAAIDAQMPIVEKARLADYTVDNNGTWSDTQRQLEEIKKSGIVNMLVAGKDKVRVR